MHLTCLTILVLFAQVCIAANVYVGGAFLPLMKDIAANGTIVPRNVGFWLHPMGLDAARVSGILPQVLAKFKTKVYAYEQDLDAWTDGSNPVQTNTPWFWEDMLRQNGGRGWKCGLAAAWAKSKDIATPSIAISKYKPLFDKMRKKGCKNLWIFWSPPSEPEIARKALKGKTWNKIFAAVGANGAMVDHPANRVDTLDVSFEFLKDARKAGLQVGWVFNGGDTGNQTLRMMQRINSNFGKLDVYAVDNFDKPSNGWRPVKRHLDAVLQTLN